MSFQLFQNNQDTKVGKCETSCLSSTEKKVSLGSLITWNITKVLEACPYIDLKNALRSTQARMERDSRDGAPIMCLLPEEQYLAGAVLAWYRLGHERTDSLYEFVKSNSGEYKVVESVSSIKVVNRNISKIRSCFTSSSSFDVKSITGPVIRLPLQTKTVMRVEKNVLCRFDNVSPKSRQKNKMDKKNGESKKEKVKSEVKNKVKAACMDFGIDKEYLPKLAELEETILDLRTRVANISRRKMERIELLERTDIAWKDLELGYERRSKLAEEKANDIENQIKRILEERNSLKTKCKDLVEDLKKRSVEAEAMREKLTQVDKEVCSLACERVRLSELSTQDDGAVAAEHCRLAQIERELEFKEQAERRKIQYLESEVSTARGLTIEAERAIRSDMAAIQENLKQVTNEINKEKSKNESLKAEILVLQKKKVELNCELSDCNTKCHDDMQRKIDLLKCKKKDYAALKDKLMDCQCKLPIDASTEAKRTPSLAANCVCETNCNPKPRSCTSLRNQLMTELLGSLFEGLMSDLCATGSLMPCQLLKCLDDHHDWERDSILRTNIHSYCTQLIIGELNIVITTTIENSYTKWLDGGSACKGNLKGGVDLCDLDERTRKVAAELADQMFKRKAEEFTKKALKVVSSRMQPCQCKTEVKKASAVYPLLIEPPNTRRNESSSLKRTTNNIAQLREQIEIIKKETIGKNDLKVMEDKLTKIINRASNSKSKSKKHVSQFFIINDDKPERDEDVKVSKERDKIKMENFGLTELTDVKKKFHSKPRAIVQMPRKYFKKITFPPTIEVYVCDVQQESNNRNKNIIKTYRKCKSNNPEISNTNIKKCNSLYESYLNDRNDKQGMEQGSKICPKECVCIHKIPSHTSIHQFKKSLSKTESFLNEEVKPSILENNINLLNKNANSCNDEILKSNIIIRFPKTNSIKSFFENESIPSLANNTLKSNENYEELKTNIHISKNIKNEYGTPIKDSSIFKESHDENVSRIGSIPQSCVCCNAENLNAHEIEMNALSLLKEHIKDKIKDLKLNLKYYIPADEEKKIYKNIFKEIKKYINNDTFEQLYKCSFENHEGSRQRAYNLLKEYLKIKIKRVQCSCCKKYDQSDKYLPTILDKITDLIENDFDRLKLKYKEFKNINCSVVSSKKSEKEIRNIEKNENQSILINEISQYFDSVCGQEICQKDMSAQVSLNCNLQNPTRGVQKIFHADKKPNFYSSANPINEYVETYNMQNTSQEKENVSDQVSQYLYSQSKSSHAMQNVEKYCNVDNEVSCKLHNDVYITDCNCYKLESNFAEATRFDTKSLHFDINDNFFGLNY